MDTFLEEKKPEKRGVNKATVTAALAAVLLVAAAIGALFLFVPTSEEKKEQAYEGAVYEGSPEFEEYTKQLVITTDFNKTTEATLAIGTIQMAVHGTIRNKGTRAVNLLEVSVGVVDMKNNVIKEKKTLVVPAQHGSIQPNETVAVFVPLDGFKKDDDRANVRWKVTAIRFQ